MKGLTFELHQIFTHERVPDDDGAVVSRTENIFKLLAVVEMFDRSLVPYKLDSELKTAYPLSIDVNRVVPRSEDQ
jgi:hypothetical protein